MIKHKNELKSPVKKRVGFNKRLTRCGKVVNPIESHAQWRYVTCKDCLNQKAKEKKASAFTKLCNDVYFGRSLTV